MVVVLWTLVGIFWLCVGINTWAIASAASRLWVNRSDERKTKRHQLANKAATVLLNVINWVRVRVFRRPSLEAKYANDPKTRYQIVNMMAAEGVRVQYVQEDGEWVLKIHNDDIAKLPKAIENILSEEETV